MKTLRIAVLAALVAVPVSVAHAQFTLGLGGGIGVGSRGGESGGGHGNVSLEFKLPVLPGIRADAYAVDDKASDGKFALAVSGVLTAPIPVVTPYLIAGWGSYGLGGDSTSTGWNVGLGVRAGLIVGPKFFIEARRHDKISRDLVTVGIRF
jgi:hypothetical protein